MLHLHLLVRLTSFRAKFVDRSKSGETIDVRSTPGPNTGEIQYLVVNNSSSILHINDIPVGPAETAGPLPEFAVFMIAQSSFFWWHTAAALDYMPVSGLLCVYWLAVVTLTGFSRVSNANAVLVTATEKRLEKVSKAIPGVPRIMMGKRPGKPSKATLGVLRITPGKSLEKR